MNIIRCAATNCPQVKHEENHWWMVARFGTDILQLAPWREELAGILGIKSACGLECAMKLVSELAQEIANEQRKRKQL